MATSTKLMGMYLQDPSIPDLTDNYAFPLDSDFLEGSSSSKFLVRDSNEKELPLYAGMDWGAAADLSFEEFKNKGAIDNPQFHQVNAFAVASHTLAFVEEELGREILWRTEGPLLIRPHAFEGPNAYYDPASPSLNFGYFNSPFVRTPVWVCLAHDVVSHELGHAILDNLRPLFLYSGNIDVGALHESFGDIMAMFSAFEHPAIVAQVYKDTDGDMFHPNLASGLAEQFGVGVFGAGQPYLRSALFGPDYNPMNPSEAHERSTIWTAALYEILALLVQTEKPTTEKEFFAAICDATHWLKGMFFRALSYTAPTGVTMPMLARLIYEADARVFPKDNQFRELAKRVFEKRKIWNPKISLAAPDIGKGVEKLQDQGNAALCRFLHENAAALRIPLGMGARIRTPSLITTHRAADTVIAKGDKSVTLEITEHYLSYSYELLMVIPKADQIKVIVTYSGGTLAMDEDWKAVMLVTDPEPQTSDPAGPQGIMAAFERERDRFESVRRRAGCPLQGIDAQASPWPFQLEQMGSGAARFTLRRCNLMDHIRGVSLQHRFFPYATHAMDLSGDGDGRQRLFPDATRAKELSGVGNGR